MLLVFVRSHVKSFLRYKLLILDTYHPDTVFTSARMWGSVVIFRSQKEPTSRKVGVLE